MSNIIVTGDSWSCIPFSSYHFPFVIEELADTHFFPESNNIWQQPGFDIKNTFNIFDWIDFQLISRGHNVNNIGCWSESNMRQLLKTHGYIEGAERSSNNIDIVIWFHTEITRDWVHPQTWSNAKKVGYESHLSLTARSTYNYVSWLKKRYPNTKWAIIGGHAPLHEKEKHLLDWAEYRVDNWRQQISGVECPETHLLSFLKNDHKEINNLLSLEQKEQELSKIEIILEACKDNKLFFDNVHPNIEPNKKLALDIIQHLNL